MSNITDKLNDNNNILTDDTDNKTLSTRLLTAYKNRKAGMERAQKIRLSMAERRDKAEAENILLKEQIAAQKKQIDDIMFNIIPNLKRKAEEITDNAIPFPTSIIQPQIQEIKSIQEVKQMKQEIIPDKQENKLVENKENNVVNKENDVVNKENNIINEEEQNDINMEDNDNDNNDNEIEEEMINEEDEDTNIINIINNIKSISNPTHYVRESSQVRTSQHKAPRLSNSQAFLEHTMQYNSYTNHPSRIPNKPQTLNNVTSDGLIWL